MNRCIRYNFIFGIVWRTVLFAALALLTAFRITESLHKSRLQNGF